VQFNNELACISRFLSPVLIRITFKPTVPPPTPPPPPKVPEERQHWYLNEVLAINHEDREMLGPDEWEGVLIDTMYMYICICLTLAVDDVQLVTCSV
jgi:hypothetical protein